MYDVLFGELKNRVNATSTGEDGWIGTCPCHDDKSPSLSVKNADGKILVHCHAGCSQEALINHFTKIGLWPTKTKKSYPSPQRRIWDQGIPISPDSTCAAGKYLRRRGLSIWSKDFRFVESIDNKEGDQTTYHPGLIVGIFTPDRNLIGVQRIYLTCDGEKAAVPVQKKVVGKLKGGFALLGEVEPHMAVAEGPETSCAVHEATGLSTICAINSGNMPNLELPEDLVRLDIFADNDDVGKSKATKLHERAYDKGINVNVYYPTDRGADFLDVFNKGGKDAVLEIVKSGPSAKFPQRTIRASEVKPTVTKFLVSPYLPIGQLTLLVGNPGLGKSYLAYSIAAALSVGNKLFDQYLRTGTIMIANAEDSHSSTIVPRLTSLGANLDNIVLFDTTKISRLDDPNFAKEVRKTKPILLIVDPIQAFLGKANMNRANEVRAAMAPLRKIAEDTNCAILLVGHLNKDTSQSVLFRSLGSIDFVANARSVLAAGQYLDDPEKRALVHIKSNVSGLGDSQGFRILPNEGVGEFVWTGKCELGAADISGDQTSNSMVSEAKEFLKEVLAEGPVSVKQIMDMAEERELSKGAVHRTKAVLKVDVKRVGVSGGARGEGGWKWSLPETIS
jgi:hypothetical protein